MALDKDLSKDLGMLLRYKAQKRGIQMTHDGFVNIDDVARYLERTVPDIRTVSEASYKRDEARFEVQEFNGVTLIRALRKRKIEGSPPQNIFPAQDRRPSPPPHYAPFAGASSMGGFASSDQVIKAAWKRHGAPSEVHGKVHPHQECTFGGGHAGVLAPWSISSPKVPLPSMGQSLEEHYVLSSCATETWHQSTEVGQHELVEKLQEEQEKHKSELERSNQRTVRRWQKNALERKTQECQALREELLRVKAALKEKDPGGPDLRGSALEDLNDGGPDHQQGANMQRQAHNVCRGDKGSSKHLEDKVLDVEGNSSKAVTCSSPVTPPAMEDENLHFENLGIQSVNRRRQGPSFVIASVAGGSCWLTAEADLTVDFLGQTRRAQVVTCKPYPVESVVRAAQLSGLPVPILWNIGHKGFRDRQFYPVLDCVKKCLNEGNDVIFHCKAGVHRAATATSIMIMYLAGCTFEQARETVEARRYVEIDNFLSPEDKMQWLGEWEREALTTSRYRIKLQ